MINVSTGHMSIPATRLRASRLAPCEGGARPGGAHPPAGAPGRCSMADVTNDRAMISEREMVSEKVAPTLVGRVLNSFDLVVIFVALVLFISNSSTVQF